MGRFAAHLHLGEPHYCSRFQRKRVTHRWRLRMVTVADLGRSRAAPSHHRLPPVGKERRRGRSVLRAELRCLAARCRRAHGWAPEGWSRRLEPEALRPDLRWEAIVRSRSPLAEPRRADPRSVARGGTDVDPRDYSRGDGRGAMLGFVVDRRLGEARCARSSKFCAGLGRGHPAAWSQFSVESSCRIAGPSW